MSIRYGISLILQPSFTAGLHRARQTLCSQYACWAAEMHMVHLPLVDYFPGPDAAVASLDSALSQAAAEHRQANPDAFLGREKIVADLDSGSIFVEFSDAGNVLGQLQAGISQIMGQRQLQPEGDTAGLRVALMQHADLPPAVFRSAANFAAGLLDGSDLPQYAPVSELVLIRFESDAAGNHWRGGGWAADLRWQIINCYPLA